MPYSSLFKSVQDADNCAALTTQGTNLYLGTPARCKTEPDKYQLVTSAAVSGEVVNVFIQSPYPAGITAPTVYLDQGRKLYFYDPLTPTTFAVAVVAESTEVTGLTSGTATAVAINPLSGGVSITGGMIASVWPMGLLTGTESLGWNLTSGSESTTRLAAGLKGQEAITSLMLAFPASVIITPDDPILWKVMHQAATTASYVFAFSSRPGGQFAWGTAQVANYNRAGEKQTIQKAAFELKMQDDWAMPAAAKYLSTQEQTYIAEIARLVGITVPSFV